MGCFLTCLTLTRKVILVNFSNCLYIFHAIQPELIGVLFVLGNVFRSEIYAWKVIFPRKQDYGKVWLDWYPWHINRCWAMNVAVAWWRKCRLWYRWYFCSYGEVCRYFVGFCLEPQNIYIYTWCIFMYILHLLQNVRLMIFRCIVTSVMQCMFITKCPSSSFVI